MGNKKLNYSQINEWIIFHVVTDRLRTNAKFVSSH